MLLNKKNKKELIEKCCVEWEKENPDPKCELFYRSPFQLLVSVVLSAQTTDKMVNKVMEPLYKKGFTTKTVLGLKEEGLYQKIKSIGLAPTKSKNIFRLTNLLLEKHSGSVPDTREELEALPGVGRKTANVILGEVFHEPTLAVDTHVLRVSRRLGLHKEKAPEKAEKELMSLINKKLLPKAHHWFILHGRYTCKARKPSCETCSLESFCPKVL